MNYWESLVIPLLLAVLRAEVQLMIDRKERRKDRLVMDHIESQLTQLLIQPSMIIFSQKEEPWAGIQLGNSPYRIGSYGCLTTAHAEAFRLAGYLTLTPLEVVESFNEHGVYTDVHYLESVPGKGDGLAGLLLWYKVSSAFPMYHFKVEGSGAFHFIQVIASWGDQRFEHWVLEYQGTIYDPFDGTTGLKNNYRKTGLVRTADIDTPVHQVPILPDLAKYPPNGYPQTTIHKPVNIRTRCDRLDPADVVEVIKPFKIMEGIIIGVPQDYQLITTGVAVEGNNQWFKKPNGTYFWTGVTDYDGTI